MRYDEYLREGSPIASGVIEGACRHLVIDSCLPTLTHPRIASLNFAALAQG